MTTAFEQAVQRLIPHPSAAGQPLLEISGLTKEFPNGKRALDGVDLKLHRGELTAVLGPNGSGKSTLLRCAVRLIPPSHGSVRIGGRDLAQLGGAGLREARCTVAMVFQHANLVRRRSALANVVMGTLGRHHDWRTALGRLPAEELAYCVQCLKRVGLEKVAEQRADTLSGGQAQRVAIARGLSQRPYVMLADEPVASLDPEAADEVMALLRSLAEDQGLGVLCILHQPDLAERFAHRVVGMKSGRLVFDLPTARLSPSAVSDLYRAEAA